MDRVAAALLAFIGTGEVEKKPLSLAPLQERQADRDRLQLLFDEGLVEIEGDHLICTVKGWGALDGRRRLPAFGYSVTRQALLDNLGEWDARA